MKYVILTIVLAVLKDSCPLNPEILKYDGYMKDFEATGRQLKQEKNKEMNPLIVKREDQSTYANLEERYSAVIPLKGYEQFYFDIKKSETPKPHFKEETFEKKLNVCSAILNADWFTKRMNYDPVFLDHNATYLEQMKEFYAENFKVHPTEHKVPNETKEFENPYILHDVPSNESSQEYKEYTFLCIATNDDEGIIAHFFISPEYNLKDSSIKDAGNPTGRFVFVKHGLHKREVFPFALAEGPGYKLKHGPNSVEHIFQDEIKGEIEEKRVTVAFHSGEICELTPFQKMRLCSVIMNAKRYRDEIMFIPSGDELMCIWKEIHFKHFADPIGMWMLACDETKWKNGTSLNYYPYITSSFSARNKFYLSKGYDVNVTLLDSIVSTVLQ